MQPLGLNPLASPIERTSGVGSSNIPTHFCNIQIDLGMTKIPVYAGFTTGLEQIGYGLLGQAGFFDKFNITFKHSQGVFQIEVP
jgi:hypothetical protein